VATLAADARRVIEARMAQASADFAARLTARAAKLAQAYGAALLRGRRDDPTRWRRAALLWPLFTRDR
jgi:hypothetical protein